ncbi:MAG: thioether cross-link-forming SCIFF peptide maturase [Clostridiales bacterium]|jgi:uncharacterized protein|nr:thioether cross-link-forming SCIFF peptide maturase [Clostridiales bacterium]
MLHTFKFSHRGELRYYLFESENGSLLEIERPVFLYLKNGNGELTQEEKAELDSLDGAVVKEIADELNELKERGIIGVEEERIDIKKSGFIKSLCLNVCHDCNLRCAYCFAAQGTYETENGKQNAESATCNKGGTAREKGNSESLSCGKNEREKSEPADEKTKYKNADEKYMSLPTAKAAVDFLVKASGPRRNLEIDFFGGEPLMNFGVVKAVVDYARQKCKENGKNIAFTMTTNALLLNKKTAGYLDENMDNVVISIDGRREVHDALRKTAGGAGSFDRVLKNALEFRDIRGEKKYYVRGTYTGRNPDFGEDVLFLNDCGFDRISVEPVVLPEDDPLALRLSDAEKIKSEYERFASEYLERRKTAKRFDFFHFMIDLDKGPCVYKRLNGCGAGDEYAAVTPSGDIYPCHQFIGKPEFLMGNVIEGGGVDSAVQEKFQRSTVYTKDKCGECFAKYFCSGGCAANSVTYERDINKTNALYCAVMRKRLELSLAIRAAEKKRGG